MYVIKLWKNHTALCNFTIPGPVKYKLILYQSTKPLISSRILPILHHWSKDILQQGKFLYANHIGGYQKSEICIPRNETRSQFLHSCVCERFIYSKDLSAYLAADRSWEYISRSQLYEWGNWRQDITILF